MILDAQAAARTALGRAGDWLTADQRIDVWAEVRDAQTNPLDQARKEALSAKLVDGDHPATAHLSATAVEVVHRVASDPGRLTRDWAEQCMAELGSGVYTELVGVTAVAMAVDRFAAATGEDLPPLPTAAPSSPAQIVPLDVGDVGAWVPQTLGPTRANVSRALSGVPETNETWRQLVDSHYSRGAEFMSATWDRSLSRPQVELVAARVTALNECFY